MTDDRTVEASELLSLAEAKLATRHGGGWLRSLVRAGLLNRPRIHAITGRHGGRAPGRWTASDRAVFVRVLDGISNGQTRAELANIVVLAWLEKGSEYVPARQLRRALATNWDASGNRRHSRQTALQLAELFAGGPGMSRPARRRFIDAFERASQGDAIDPEGLRSPAFDPTGIGPTPLRSAIAPDGLIAALAAWHAGRTDIDTIDDSTLETARGVCCQVMRDYTRLDASQKIATLLRIDTHDLLTRNASTCVLLTLGVFKPNLVDGSPAARRA